MAERRYGPYHRIANSTSQTPALARQQLASGELWGKAARNIFSSNLPCVKAFDGPLPAHEQGIEFYTDIPPSSGSVPSQPRWYLGHAGVMHKTDTSGEDHAVIAVTITVMRP